MGPPPPSLAVPLLLYQARHGGEQEEAKGSPVTPVPCMVSSPFLSTFHKIFLILGDCISTSLQITGQEVGNLPTSAALMA